MDSCYAAEEQHIQLKQVAHAIEAKTAVQQRNIALQLV